ncbi:DUF3572 domain-containing protein [Palleronia sp.]|uniref:DUF3572 domain-containing protein n=1 Tax=Palleronia sp. TaxID=1940284 RepID=UPI0035C7E8EA
MKQEDAEALSKDVLLWLAAHDDLLLVFLNSTGGDAESIRNGVNDPFFLAAVLDFLMMDDAWVVACCDAIGMPYDRPARARAALPGGAETHWT